jgi:hypothetical protein
MHMESKKNSKVSSFFSVMIFAGIIALGLIFLANLAYHLISGH